MVLWSQTQNVDEDNWQEEGKNREWDSSVKNVGVDLGYGYVKFFEGKEPRMFPSVVGLGKSTKYKNDLMMDADPLKNLHIVIGDKSYFVGELAIRQSEVASRSLDQDRSKDKNAKILMLTALSLLCKWEEQDFNLVTGLPTNYYAAFNESWKETLKGDFETKLSRDGKFLTRQFSVDKIRVVPQPFGTLFDQVLNSMGKIVDQELTESRVGIVDIGFKTTDLAAADNMEFIDKFSYSTSTGLNNVYRLVGDVLRRDFKIDREDHQLDGCIDTKQIKVAGKTNDISNYVDEAFKIVAEKIITEIDSRWDFREFDRILLTGGGGKVLGPYLLERFANMVLVDEPQLANVRGYQKLSNNIFGSGD